MNPIIDIYSLLGITISGIGFFHAIFFLLKDKFRNQTYTLLYISVLIISYELFYKTLTHSRLMYDFAILYIPGRFYNLLIYPIFLLFIWSFTKQKTTIKTYHWILLTPFIGYVIYSLSFGLTFSIEEKKHILDLFYADNRPGPFNYWGNWETLIKTTIIPIIFLSIIGDEFFHFKARNTNLQNKNIINILSFLIVYYFLFIQFSNVVYKWSYQITGYSMIEWPIDIISLSVINILLSSIALSVNSGSAFLPPVKYENSSLDNNSYEKIVLEAQKLIAEYELYKNDKLTLIEISNKLGINSKYLSQAINHHLNVNFVDFINQYRIDHVKEQLNDQSNKHFTLEAIGNNSGFKSKSSFFRAFKKLTGQTPNEFKQSIN